MKKGAKCWTARRARLSARPAIVARARPATTLIASYPISARERPPFPYAAAVADPPSRGPLPRPHRVVFVLSGVYSLSSSP